MPTNDEQEPPCVQASVRVATPDGDREVPGLVTPLAPGLAVTMCDFGRFEVTHIPSGRTLPGGRWQRVGSALACLAEYATIGRAYGVDYTADGDAVRAALLACCDQPVPFDGATVTNIAGTRPMAVGEWWRGHHGWFADDEFPWESSDDDPENRAVRLLTATHTNATEASV